MELPKVMIDHYDFFIFIIVVCFLCCFVAFIAFISINYCDKKRRNSSVESSQIVEVEVIDKI